MNQYQKLLQNMSLITLYLQSPKEMKQFIDVKLREFNAGYNSSNNSPDLTYYQQSLQEFWSNHHQNIELIQSNQNQERLKSIDINFYQIQNFSDFKSEFELTLMHLQTYQQQCILRENTQKNYIEVFLEKKKLQEQLEQQIKSEKLLVQDNQNLQQQISKLKSEIQDLKNQINNNQLFFKETQELRQSKVEIVKLQQENQSLQNQIHKLYDQMELDKQHVLQNQVIQLEQQMKIQGDQLAQANAEIKKYTNEIQQLQMRNFKINNCNFEQLGIRCIPIFNGVPTYFYSIMYLLELMTPLNKILVVNEKVSLIIYQFINYIRKENDQIQSSTAIQLQELIKIQNQNDNKANDFLFQIIDHLTKVIIKNEQQKSQIATIIQTQDSPIFDMFFFLQRSFPINMEILPNEVPLINSIKYVRYFENLITPQGEFSKYLNDLIKLEGQENKIDENDADFNFIIFPQFLIFNTSELSFQQADMKISLNIQSTSLNPEQTDFQYQLISIIHCNNEDNQLNYMITLCKNKTWVQIKQENVYKVDINTILTFQQPHNNKELLIYEKISL
ncbi:unnamed protein product [Paramecium pentaurelia]|uniref:Uncharacterized protein n=1 Tax=Paramecium pentaurelia TaxID=43138 RepID=A0A8S1X8W9_9CILI|nr:unnamed protein product [Paramecium pentaurelia]